MAEWSAQLACGVCGDQVDGRGPAVGEYDREGDLESFWIAFVEDLRTSGFTLVHPRCFATTRGVDALVQVVHERDAADRGGVSMATIWADPSRLAPHPAGPEPPA